VLEANRQIIQFEKENSEVMAILQYLSDHIGPRLTGSENMQRASEWTAQKMKEYGLVNVSLEPFTIPRGWQRGHVEMTMLEPFEHPIEAASMGWTPGTRGTVKGAVVLFDPQSEAEMQSFKGKLRGAIVLRGAPANVNQHFPKPNGTDEIGERTQPQEDWRSKLNDFMHREGVAAILRDSGKPHQLLNMTGSWGASNPLPTLFITNEDYSRFYRLIKEGVTPKARLRVEARFTKGPVTVYNTVGDIQGSEKPDEYVICGGHLDSWDLGTGTTDNGTGSSVTLEAARILAKLGLKPKRTIRFVLFCGEEQGLHGSQAYVQAHKDELAKISGVFVHDTGTGRVNGIGLHGSGHLQPMFEMELAALKDLGVERYSNFLMGGTDHASYYAAGVPGFWYMQESADYNLTHHSQSDTYDKALKDDLIQGATAMAICVYNVAQLPDLLPRKAELVSTKYKKDEATPAKVETPGTPDDGISGEWKGKVTGPAPVPPDGMEVTLRLKLEANNSLSGELETPLGTLNFKDGVYKKESGEVAFTLSIDGENAPVKGQMQGSALTGTLSVMGMTFQIKLEHRK
jgi:carboxypeptidase Q